MSDDFGIPAPAGRAPISSSYRPRRGGAGRVGGEPGMRMAIWAAAGLGGLLLVGLGGWAVMGRRPATIPVIEADSRPLRVKPENPGGMQVAGADEMVLGDQAVGSEKMAPAAEAPAPQALRAQMQQGTAVPAAPAAAPPLAPTAGAAAVAATPAPAGLGVAPGVSPLPDTPARPAAVARSAPEAVSRSASAPVAKPAPAGGATLVQLGALSSEAAAQGEWQRLVKTAPEVLGDRRPTVQKLERDGRTFWRLRTGGFADVAEATGFCAKLRAKGGNCTIASF